MTSISQPFPSGVRLNSGDRGTRLATWSSRQDTTASPKEGAFSPGSHNRCLVLTDHVYRSFAFSNSIWGMLD